MGKASAAFCRRSLPDWALAIASCSPQIANPAASRAKPQRISTSTPRQPARVAGRLIPCLAPKVVDGVFRFFQSERRPLSIELDRRDL